MIKLYIVEGETEANFIKAMQKSRLMDMGIIRKINLYEGVLKKSDSVFTKMYSEIWALVDVDVILRDNSHTHVNRLHQNLILLTENSRKIELKIQLENFEDELSRALGVGDLNKLFNIKSGTGDLKKHLCKDGVYSKLIKDKKLNKHKISTLWNQYDAFLARNPEQYGKLERFIKRKTKK